MSPKFPSNRHSNEGNSLDNDHLERSEHPETRQKDELGPLQLWDTISSNSTSREGDKAHKMVKNKMASYTPLPNMDIKMHNISRFMGNLTSVL